MPPPWMSARDREIESYTNDEPSSDTTVDEQHMISVMADGTGNLHIQQNTEQIVAIEGPIKKTKKQTITMN